MALISHSVKKIEGPLLFLNPISNIKYNEIVRINTPNKEKIGKVTRSQLRQIAEQKMADLNAKTVDQAIKIVEGSARTMGIEVESE